MRLLIIFCIVFASAFAEDVIVDDVPITFESRLRRNGPKFSTKRKMFERLDSSISDDDDVPVRSDVCWTVDDVNKMSSPYAPIEKMPDIYLEPDKPNPIDDAVAVERSELTEETRDITYPEIGERQSYGYDASYGGTYEQQPSGNDYKVYGPFVNRQPLVRPVGDMTRNVQYPCDTTRTKSVQIEPLTRDILTEDDSSNCRKKQKIVYRKSRPSKYLEKSTDQKITRALSNVQVIDPNDKVCNLNLNTHTQVCEDSSCSGNRNPYKRPYPISNCRDKVAIRDSDGNIVELTKGCANNAIITPSGQTISVDPNRNVVKVSDPPNERNCGNVCQDCNDNCPSQNDNVCVSQENNARRRIPISPQNDDCDTTVIRNHPTQRNVYNGRSTRLQNRRYNNDNNRNHSSQRNPEVYSNTNQRYVDSTCDESCSSEIDSVRNCDDYPSPRNIQTCSENDERILDSEYGESDLNENCNRNYNQECLPQRNPSDCSRNNGRTLNSNSYRKSTNRRFDENIDSDCDVNYPIPGDSCECDDISSENYRRSNTCNKNNQPTKVIDSNYQSYRETNQKCENDSYPNNKSSYRYQNNRRTIVGSNGRISSNRRNSDGSVDCEDSDIQYNCNRNPSRRFNSERRYINNPNQNSDECCENYREPVLSTSNNRASSRSSTQLDDYQNLPKNAIPQRNGQILFDPCDTPSIRDHPTRAHHKRKHHQIKKIPTFNHSTQPIVTTERNQSKNCSSKASQKHSQQETQKQQNSFDNVTLVNNNESTSVQGSSTGKPLPSRVSSSQSIQPVKTNVIQSANKLDTTDLNSSNIPQTTNNNNIQEPIENIESTYIPQNEVIENTPQNIQEPTKVVSTSNAEAVNPYPNQRNPNASNIVESQMDIDPISNNLENKQTIEPTQDVFELPKNENIANTGSSLKQQTTEQNQQQPVVVVDPKDLGSSTQQELTDETAAIAENVSKILKTTGGLQKQLQKNGNVQVPIIL